MIDVTNSKKDWHDFWYSNEHMYPNETKHEYNELVDYLVSNMTLHSTKDSYTQTGDINAPFDTQAYDNYKDSLSSTERKSFDELYEEYRNKSVEDQIENLKELGRELVTRIDRIVDRLDVILEEDKKD